MWLPNCRYVFACNFYKQYLSAVKFRRHNEKNRGFHLISKSPLRWKNPYVIGTYTFKSLLKNKKVIECDHLFHSGNETSKQSLIIDNIEHGEKHDLFISRNQITIACQYLNYTCCTSLLLGKFFMHSFFYLYE